MPNETIGWNGYSEMKFTSLNAAFGVPQGCHPAENSKETNTSLINSIDYQLISIENYSERDRENAAEQTRKKEEQSQIAKLQEENESYQNGTQFMIDQLPANEKPYFQSRLSAIERMSTQSQKSEYDKMQRELSEKDRQFLASQVEKRAETLQLSTQANTRSQQTPNNRNSSAQTSSQKPGSSTIPPKYASVAGSNILNGTDRSKLPILVMDTNGNHYVKDIENQYHKVTGQQYQVLKQQAAGTNAAAGRAAKKVTAEAALAEFERNRVAAEVKRQQETVEVTRMVDGFTTMATNIINDARQQR